MQPPRFQTEGAKIAYIISLLTGHELQWAKSIGEQDGPTTYTLVAFTINLMVFGQTANTLSVHD